MDINWSRYIEIARAQDLGSAEVARLIRTETRRKVNISEVKRRLSVSGPSAAQIRQPDSLDVAGYGLGTTFPVPRNRLRFFKFGLPGQPLISRDRLALQFSRFFSLFPC